MAYGVYKGQRSHVLTVNGLARGGLNSGQPGSDVVTVHKVRQEHFLCQLLFSPEKVKSRLMSSTLATTHRLTAVLLL